MTRHLERRLQRGLAALLVVSLAGCGTILYPERRGQSSGRLDAGVVVLDAVGLLFFFVPGVIAFAVDFATGAIYLPSHHTHSRTGGPEIQALPLPSRDRETILAFVASRTGLELDARSLQVRPARPGEDVGALLLEWNAHLAAAPVPQG